MTASAHTFYDPKTSRLVDVQSHTSSDLRSFLTRRGMFVLGVDARRVVEAELARREGDQR